jgi:hypothetical protein
MKIFEFEENFVIAIDNNSNDVNRVAYLYFYLMKPTKIVFVAQFLVNVLLILV